jgi:hypothetical protein
MSNKQHVYVFEQLGRNANGGPLRSPFDEPTTATDVAIAIHAVLVEAGLSPATIRNIGRSLINVSRIDERGDDDASHARETRGENHP